MAIPKINISTKRKKEKCNLDFDSFTTANFGFVQPTMAREMIPGSRFDVQVMSKVRMASLPSPTFGRLYLKHQHVFVPYIDVCPQYNSFISGQHFTNNTGSIFQPIQVPYFDLQSISQYVLGNYADFSIYKFDPLDPNGDINGYVPIQISSPALSTIDILESTALKAAWSHIVYSYNIRFNVNTNNTYRFYSNNLKLINTDVNRNYLIDVNGLSAGPVDRGQNEFSRHGRLLAGYWYVNCTNKIDSSDSNFDFSSSLVLDNKYIQPLNDYQMITDDSADYICEFHDGDYTGGTLYKVCLRLTPMGKRIRQILIGLGYQFSPLFKIDNCNWLKLLAFYRAYYCLNNPMRNTAFTSTNAYILIKSMTTSTPLSDLYYDISNGLINNNYERYWYVAKPIVTSFIEDLGRCTSYLPQDYYSMSTTRPVNLEQNAPDVLSTYSLNIASQLTGAIIESSKNDQSSNVGQVIIHNNTQPVYGRQIGANIFSPLTVQLANRVLKYINKNSVTGRSIHDFIKAHFGVSIDDRNVDGDSVYLIGESSTDIYVGDIYSQSETAEGRLGEYAGRGEGSGMSEKFFYENGDFFGVWITLTTIMPKSGFYQGIMRENMAMRKFDFFTPEYDACGADIIPRGELMADYTVKFTDTTMFESNDTLNAGFGFVPRYSHLKVGRDIVNGDFSLRSLRNDMQSYHLMRQIPNDEVRSVIVQSQGKAIKKSGVFNPNFRINSVTEEFRRIDEADVVGNYNRIFYYTKPDLDHFLIFNVFSVTAYLPAKSLSDSYDTIDSDTDVSEFVHS